MTELIDEVNVSVLCPNCHFELRGQFCAACGQNQKGNDRFFLTLIADAVEDIFTFDSRASKTIVRLIFKPGNLTKEYFRGRRARYVQPLRLYFITSLTFFFFMTVQNVVRNQDLDISAGDASQQQVSEEIDRALNEAKMNKKNLGEKKEIEESLDEFLSELNLGLLPETLDQKFEKRFEAQIKKAVEVGKENPKEILNKLLDLAPPVIFCLLPIFALLLKIVYINTGRYYTEHLILAVHNQCFIFLILFISGLFGLIPENVFIELINSLILIWIPIYLFLSLKHTYEEGWFLTTVKYTTLGISYAMLFAFISLIAVVIGILTL
ncbi:MAG: hypothetical protein ACI9CE_000715 [Flavobacterium sp.]